MCCALSLPAQEGWVHFQLKDLHSTRELQDTPEQIQKALKESGLGAGDEEGAISKSGTGVRALLLRPNQEETPGQNSAESADSALPAKAAPVDSVAGEIETERQNKSDTSVGEATKTAGAGDTDGPGDGCSQFSQADIAQMFRQFEDSEVEPVASELVQVKEEPLGEPPTAMREEVKQQLDPAPCAAAGSTAVNETAETETEATQVPAEPVDSVDPWQPVVGPEVPAEPSQSVVVEPENMNAMNTTVAGFLHRFDRTAVARGFCLRVLFCFTAVQAEHMWLAC